MIFLMALIGLTVFSIGLVYSSSYNYETLERTDGKQMTIQIPSEIEYDKVTLEEIAEAKERRMGLD